MNQDIKQIKEKIKGFEGQNVFIKVENVIQFYTTIQNAKIIVSDQKLIVSDEKEKDFIVELFYLENVTIEGNSVYLELSNDINIILDW